MSTIWVFREQRTGGTAFVDLLCKQLGKRNYFAHPEEVGSHISDQNELIINTHSFEFLDYLGDYENPTLIRCARRNKTEQFLSILMLHWMGATVYRHTDVRNRGYNIQPDTPSDFINLFNSVPPAIITKREVLAVARLSKLCDDKWNAIAPRYNGVTVYYEDLCEGVDIPLLGLTNVKLTPELDVKPLPTDYKKNVFLNYDMLVKWANEISEELFNT